MAIRKITEGMSGSDVADLIYENDITVYTELEGLWGAMEGKADVSQIPDVSGFIRNGANDYIGLQATDGIDLSSDRQMGIFCASDFDVYAEQGNISLNTDRRAYYNGNEIATTNQIPDVSGFIVNGYNSESVTVRPEFDLYLYAGWDVVMIPNNSVYIECPNFFTAGAEEGIRLTDTYGGITAQSAYGDIEVLSEWGNVRLFSEQGSITIESETVKFPNTGGSTSLQYLYGRDQNGDFKQITINALKTLLGV